MVVRFMVPKINILCAAVIRQQGFDNEKYIREQNRRKSPTP